ncbi:MAG: L-threonylcarbamoyladenylate synthase [Paraperlucidibaca sp.]
MLNSVLPIVRDASMLQAALFPLKQATQALRQDGVIAYATESVWGLGCDPWSEQAVHRLLEIKRRPWQKGLILIAADMAQMMPLLGRVTPEQLTLMQSRWPGPVTWLVPVSEHIPRWLRGEHDTLAMRVSAHSGVRQLCRAWGGPLVSTSANLSGQPACKTALQVRMRLGDQLDAIVPGAVSGAKRPSEIRDLISQRVLRASA